MKFGSPAECVTVGMAFERRKQKEKDRQEEERVKECEKARKEVERKERIENDKQRSIERKRIAEQKLKLKAKKSNDDKAKRVAEKFEVKKRKKRCKEVVDNAVKLRVDYERTINSVVATEIRKRRKKAKTSSIRLCCGLLMETFETVDRKNNN